MQMKMIKNTLSILILSVAIGIVTSLVRKNQNRKKYQQIIDAMKEVAKGNLDIALENDKNTEVSNLIVCFNHMVNDLKKNELLHADFMNDLSHEFKTPISSIRGFARLLTREDLSQEDRKEFAQVIENESDRLAKLSRAILLLNQVEQKEFISELQQGNVAEQLRYCVILLDEEFTNKNIDLYLELEDFECQCNNDLLCEVWMNLIDNAIKYSNFGGK